MQPMNLKKILSKAYFTEKADKKIFEVSKCNEPKCGTCTHISTGTCIKTKSGKTLLPNATMNCKSKNLMFCITCPGCGENYVGQTSLPLRERVTLHRQHIREP